MARRAKSNSTQVAVQAFREAAQKPQWPAGDVTPLPDPEQAARALDLYLRTMTSRAPQDWRASDCALVAAFANASIQLDAMTVEITKQGWTVPSARNPEIMTRNPLLDAVQHLTTRQLSLARAIGVSGLPTDARTVRGGAKAANHARAVMFNDPHSLVGDELFASPHQSMV